MDYLLSRYTDTEVVDYVPGRHPGRSPIRLIFSNGRSLLVGWPYRHDMLKLRPDFNHASIPHWHLALALDQARLFSITFLPMKKPLLLLQFTSDAIPAIHATLSFSEVREQIVLENEPELDFDEDED
ncbi:MAG TPA: hypothetical protein PKW33_21730 [Anaerolineaceae bacterium]|nr:hypothetical protein [Anaerolineaceae bacterium]HPN54230.1 hypothetical protein [Anaerolineaceae bacterium]